MRLDFVRRTQRHSLRRHPRSREISRLTICTMMIVYHFALFQVFTPLRELRESQNRLLLRGPNDSSIPHKIQNVGSTLSIILIFSPITITIVNKFKVIRI